MTDSEKETGPARPTGVPKLYEISSNNSRYTVGLSALIEDASHIKFSQFSGDFGSLTSEYCPIYESVLIQTSSGIIRRDDLKGHQSCYNGITIHGSDHGWQWSSEGQVSFCQFHISHALLADVYRSLYDKDTKSAFLPVFTGIQNSAFKKLFDAMITRFTAPHRLSRMEADAWATIFAETLIREAPGFVSRDLEAPDGCLTENEVNLVKDWIKEHLDLPISVAQIAKLTNYSEYEFARRFNQTLNLSPYQYVLEQRLHKACELLRTSRHSIAEIAFLVGFSSQSHMTDCFRRRLDTTPGAYRRAA